MKKYTYDYDRGLFVNASGGVIGVLPELTYGESAEWEITFLHSNGSIYDFAGVTSFTAAVGTPCLPVVNTPSGITVDAATGAVTIPLDCLTENFLRAVSCEGDAYAFFELSGNNATGAKVFYARFSVELNDVANPDPSAIPAFADRVLEVVSSGGFIVGNVGNTSIEVTSGGVSIVNESDSGYAEIEVSEGVNVTLGGAETRLDITSDEPLYINGGQIVVGSNGVSVNGRAVIQVMSNITDSSTTSAYIPVLSGGVQYRYTQPLTALEVASADNSPLESEIIFTLADSGTVTLPASLGIIGEPSFSGGSSYIINIRDNIMVAGAYSEGE